MDWQARLRREAIHQRLGHHVLDYWVGLRPPAPPEYEVPGLVGLTFRVQVRGDGTPHYATLLDVAATLRLGARLGLDPAESLAMVDSHERAHVALQLDYERLHEVPPEIEEAHVVVVDAAWLSLRHPVAERLVESGEVSLLRSAGRLFDALAAQEREKDGARVGWT